MTIEKKRLMQLELHSKIYKVYAMVYVEKQRDMFEKIWIKIKHIIKGNFYNICNKNNTLYNKRSTICNSCENLKIIANIKYCGICGCPIKTLTRVPEEKCHVNKW
nr:MAG TPA: Malignant T-cell-amplified sequence 1, Density-regulated, ribosome, zinc binding, tRNA [Crassvirales sp.]